MKKRTREEKMRVVQRRDEDDAGNGEGELRMLRD